ncbi:signal peptidase I [Fodinisporobacter ferrooxydans]|uniref:Signal peptidase I n=1 Tax=Fodinisporobacter ferrooxydans TaxID=2901836 RepID=A0ABY4CN34_9BACL|nr:signal peptidase I [Alicyclobacillaceae bacterium MYW30-H2]
MANKNYEASAWSVAWDWIKAIAIALIIAFLIKQFVFAFFQVSGESMDRTLANGERVLVDKIPYYFHQPQYNDIVVFHESADEDWIKRVIGRPGDTILFKNGILYRNGKQVSEPYINGPMVPGDFGPYKIPQGDLFLMGDNRNVSKDSREIGPVKISQVIGRAEVVVFPFSKFKTL